MECGCGAEKLYNVTGDASSGQQAQAQSTRDASQWNALVSDNTAVYPGPVTHPLYRIVPVPQLRSMSAVIRPIAGEVGRFHVRQGTRLRGDARYGDSAISVFRPPAPGPGFFLAGRFTAWRFSPGITRILFPTTRRPDGEAHCPDGRFRILRFSQIGTLLLFSKARRPAGDSPFSCRPFSDFAFPLAGTRLIFPNARRPDGDAPFSRPTVCGFGVLVDRHVTSIS